MVNVGPCNTQQMQTDVHNSKDAVSMAYVDKYLHAGVHCNYIPFVLISQKLDQYLCTFCRHFAGFWSW